jgi:hypothetical protein
MAENKLEGFEDFDNILGETEGEGGEEAGGDFAGELEDLLGDSAAEGGGAEAPAGGGGGDSELDSFFEDLSTIDDLEVLQEEEEPAAPGPDAEVPEMEGGVAAPTAAPAAAPAKAPRKPREKKPRGFFGRLVRWAILLAILGGGGYYVYQFFFPEFPLPWQVVTEEKDKLVSMMEEKLRQPPPPPEPEPAPPPPPAMVRAPSPAPAPRPAGPAPERGPWSIQVATCFFPSCLESYRSYLQATKRSVLVREKKASNESLEIYSLSTLGEREEAQALADRINKSHPLEGHAYLFREGGGYKISMGAFADLSRANVVRDALNRQFTGEIDFATRLKSFPYQLKSILTGRYPTRAAADQALAALRHADPRFKDAFVTRN